MDSSYGVIAQQISFSVRNNLETKVKNNKNNCHHFFPFRKEIIKTLESPIG
jgi:hypothetical protein